MTYPDLPAEWAYLDHDRPSRGGSVHPPRRCRRRLGLLADAEGLLALIVPASLRGDPDESPALFDDTRISVATPRETKGMEFDHVIVVEPASCGAGVRLQPDPGSRIWSRPRNQHANPKTGSG